MASDILSCYKQAEHIMQGYLTNRLVLNDAVFPHWIASADGVTKHHFWYRQETKQGWKFRLVNTESANNIVAFDHRVLANLLKESIGSDIDPEKLPLKNVSITINPLLVRFQFDEGFWVYSPDEERLKKDDQNSINQTGGKEQQSPDGKKVAFLRDHNLWLRTQESGVEEALTNDGVENFSYGDSLSFGMDKTLQVRWSPDSAYLFAVQLDTRGVSVRSSVGYVPQDGSFHPEANGFKLSYPGDEKIESYRLLIIDIKTGESQAVGDHHLLYLYHGPETFDGFFTGNLGWWSPDSQYVNFIDMNPVEKNVRVLRWNIVKQTMSVQLEESADTYIRICEDTASPPIFLPLPETDELIWFSERSGWAHLYLYDLGTGKLRHQITGREGVSGIPLLGRGSAEWMVRGVLHYDPEQRELLLQTAARSSEICTYYRDVCKVNIDSGILQPLISGDYDHLVVSAKQGFSVINREHYQIDNTQGLSGVSPCGQYLVTTYSRVDTPPVSVVIDREGNKILTVEIADVTQLPDNWCWPEPVKLKAADNITDLYGVVFFPAGRSSEKSYPVIDFLGGSRSINLVPTGSFINSHFTNYFEMAALAALGFFVVGIVGRGTPLRDKDFQDHNFGKPGGEDDLKDHIAGLRQLATRYPSMDIDRVGITAMESSNNVVYGALNHSSFYKVTVSHDFSDPRSSLSHLGVFDNLNDSDALLAFGGPEDRVESISGKLLLINGLKSLTDATFRLVDALERANKEFDMLCFPNMGSLLTSYSRRRGWDYLVTHLQYISPPPKFYLTTSHDILTSGSEESLN